MKLSNSTTSHKAVILDYVSRYHCYFIFVGRHMHRLRRQHVCDISDAEFEVPTDFTYGSYGPERRNMEASIFCSDGA